MCAREGIRASSMRPRGAIKNVFSVFFSFFFCTPWYFTRREMMRRRVRKAHAALAGLAVLALCAVVLVSGKVCDRVYFGPDLFLGNHVFCCLTVFRDADWGC